MTPPASFAQTLHFSKALVIFDGENPESLKSVGETQNENVQ